MTPSEIVARLIAQASGRLIRGDDPRLSQRTGTGSTGATAEPVLNTNTNPPNGDTDNGQAV